MMHGWAIVSSCSLVLFALAACRDLATRVIPDWLCAALAMIGLTVGAMSGVRALLVSLGVAALLFAGLAAAHARGMLGGGDVKLMAAAAVQFPPGGAWKLIVATSIAGGILALLHLALRRLPPPERSPPGAARMRRVWNIERWRVRRNGSLPYGVAIACGGAWVILSGWGA